MALITHFSLVVLCFRYNANFRVLTLLYCVVIYVADDSVFFSSGAEGSLSYST